MNKPHRVDRVDRVHKVHKINLDIYDSSNDLKKNINVLVGIQGCPNSIDLDTFTIIYVKPGNKFSPKLLENIEDKVISHLTYYYRRNDVETNIIFVNPENKVIIWSSRGPADGANLVPSTFKYWYSNEEICPVRKIKRSVILGIFETFNKINMCLLKTNSYRDGIPNYYAEGYFRNKIQNLTKHNTLKNLVDFYEKKIDFTNLFGITDNLKLSKNQIRDRQLRGFKIPKMKKEIDKKKNQVKSLKEKINTINKQKETTEGKWKDLDKDPNKYSEIENIQTIINELKISINHMENHIANLIIKITKDEERIYWSCESGCKKMAFQLVKSCLLTLGYENFTKEIDIPRIPSLPFIQGLIPAMNRRVNWSVLDERKMSLELMEQAKNFLCMEIKSFLEKYPQLEKVRGRNYHSSRKSFIIFNQNTKTYEEYNISNLEFPLNNSKQITDQILSELKNNSCYEHCRISSLDASQLFVTPCCQCHTITLLKDLPFQESFKHKVYCQNCLNNK